MLEFWYKEKRTLVDFRRGPLGPHIDDFAGYLGAQKYSRYAGKAILGKCCQFNGFLIDEGITTCRKLDEKLVDRFLLLYLASTRRGSTTYSPKAVARRALDLLFIYLAEAGVVKPAKPKRTKKRYGWLLDPYLVYLEKDCGFSPTTIDRARTMVGSYLDTLKGKGGRSRFKTLRAEEVEYHLSRYLKESGHNLESLAGSLRRFFSYCAARDYTRLNFSGLIPPMRRYRHASLPKGMEDGALESVLRGIDVTAAPGARDYAVMVLMMAYGLRGVSVAALLLDDIDWRSSRIRIRAQKGGKEVTVPLLESAGDALIRYLRYRPNATPFREVFLSVKAPVRPLNSLMISHIVRTHMKKVGITSPGIGSRTLRHSWAIRALAHDSPIKSIADVLGHRYIDTTFIYAKADLNSLREVALPWPGKN